MTDPYYADATVQLYAGDCLDTLRELPAASVDAVVCDPPYGLSATDTTHVIEALSHWLNGDRTFVPNVGGGFMGKSWDNFVPPPAVWDECHRAMKPGAHLLAFAGSRTHDLMALSIRLAGFEIRDSIAWLYGSGFPKSRDVARAIDSEAGAKMDRAAYIAPDGNGRGGNVRNWRADMNDATTAPERIEGTSRSVHVPATDAARTWHGWGTALKPAFEPVVVARKPLAGTVAATVLEHGTGALNIDGCRIEGDVPTTTRGGNQFGVINDDGWQPSQTGQTITPHAAGRWPANVVLDESQAAALDQQSGESVSNVRTPTGRDTRGVPNTESQMVMRVEDTTTRGMSDSGGASRFFYTAKAASDERVRVAGIAHPTVKPLALMRWLVRLVTPPGGVVLEPFAGSGTTVEACILEGFHCIAVEREPDYLPLIVQRINRRRDPVAAVRDAGGDGGLFDLLDDGGAA